MISIPKKVVSKSVRRSRLKRLVREALRTLKASPEDGIGWRFSVKKDPSESIGMAEVAVVIKNLIGQQA